jgi:hypothetical protein
MEQNTRDWLNRIEGKLDAVITRTSAHDTAIETAKNDITWLKGGASVLLTVLLGCASYVAMHYFDLIGPKP